MPRISNEDRILTEHPGVGQLLARIPHATRSISVARGDATLMWRSGETDGIYQETQPPGRVIIRNETLYLLSPAGIYYAYSWDINDRSYVCDLLQRDPRPSALAWVVRKDFHAPTRKEWEPGPFQSRELAITVYSPPIEGWQALAANPSLEDVPLTNPIVGRGVMRRREWRQLSDSLWDLSRRVQFEVYERGLRQIIHDKRGAEAKLDGITLLTFLWAGRINVQISRGGILFNSKGDAGASRANFGYLGLSGTYRQIQQLVEDFISRWAALSPADRERIVTPSTKIDLGFE